MLWTSVESSTPPDLPKCSGGCRVRQKVLQGEVRCARIHGSTLGLQPPHPQPFRHRPAPPPANLILGMKSVLCSHLARQVAQLHLPIMLCNRSASRMVTSRVVASFSIVHFCCFPVRVDLGLCPIPLIVFCGKVVVLFFFQASDFRFSFFFLSQLFFLCHVALVSLLQSLLCGYGTDIIFYISVFLWI